MTEKEFECFPTSKSAKRMLSYVTPGFYDRSYVGKWLYQVMGLEYDDASTLVEELPYQFFPETATWGLQYHEIKWGLPIRTELSYEERRKIIYQKRDMKSPMTPYRMEQLLKYITDFKVSIFDSNRNGGYIISHPNLFLVQLIGEGTADTIKIRKQLNMFKQSHTIYKLIDYIEKRIEIKILPQIQIAIKSEFYPRSNIPFLKYDGTTQYNGIVHYDKYKSAERIDLYPIRLHMASELNSRMFFFPKIRMQQIFSTPIYHTETKVGYVQENKLHTTLEQALQIRLQTPILPRYEVSLKIGKHPNRYDGRTKYDGKSRYYVAKIENL